MRRALVLLPLLWLTTSACKKKGSDDPVPPPNMPAAAAPEETPMDALTPPPPPRPADLAQAPVVTNTLNGNPNGPKQADMDAVQSQGQAKVQACLDAMPPGTSLPGGVARLAIKYEVGNDGATKGATVEGPVPPDTIACAKTALAALAFPKFEGSSVKNSFTLTYSRAQPPDLAAK